MAPTPHVLRGWDDDLQRTTEYDVVAEQLAEVSTKWERHDRLLHASDEFAPEGTRCSACRWFEARIYREVDGGWLVQTVGRSVVPGEDDRYRLHVCDTARKVVSSLVQVRQGEVFLPHTAKRLLDLAADDDEELARVVDELLDDGLDNACA